MTIVREEKNRNNGHHAGDVWRGGRCPSSRDSRVGALARFGVVGQCCRTEARNGPVSTSARESKTGCVPFRFLSVSKSDG
jgi:hypothetical protein